jgi:glycosyltransferase involved in cell wall biosynthesis
VKSLPSISIVTPSFNQGKFLRAAMCSVLNQTEITPEYIVMDGGSTDESPQIIREYEGRLHHWKSAHDDGHYAAINTGFAQSTGGVMAWLNSDDQYTSWALSIVTEIFSAFPEIEWLTTLFPMRWDERGRAVRCSPRRGYSKAAFLAGENLPMGDWYSEGCIQQETTFWRRSLWERAGGALDTRWKLAADFDLWARFFQHAELYAVDTPLGGFRWHGNQRSNLHREAYKQEAMEILRGAGGSVPGRVRSALRSTVGKHLPKGLHPLARNAGLLHECKVCTFLGADRGWKIATVLH